MQTNTKPTISATETAVLTKSLYGITATATLLPGEWDANFHLTSSDGDFVLKIMHAEQQPDIVDLQIQTLIHLARNAPHLKLPRVIVGLDGELMQTVKINDRSHIVWLLTYIDGHLLAKANPHSPELLHSFGTLLGEVDAALVGFDHPASQRDFKWDLAKANWIWDYLDTITDDGRRAIVTRFLTEFDTTTLPKLLTLRQSIIHNDANDYNVLVSNPLPVPRTAVSLIDFGDTLRSQTVNNLAIAIAYAILDKADPLTAAAQTVAGYHAAHPLTEQEVELLFNLICTRLCVSVVNSGIRKQEEPDDPYIVISERPAWDALEKLAAVHPRLAHYTFRAACGWEAVPQKLAVLQHLRTISPAQMLDTDLRTEPLHVLDLSVSSQWLGANPTAMQTPNLTAAIDALMAEKGVEVAIGRYDEVRLLYANDLFSTGDHLSTERRTIHLGIDLFAPTDTKIYAPLDGTVHLVANNAAPLDYGPVLILKHHTDDGTPFYTLYGHLAETILDRWQVGDAVAKETHIAEMGAEPINGNWPPHIHFQLILDLLDMGADFLGVSLASQRDLWRSLSPDPNIICRIPAEHFPPKETGYAKTLANRRRLLGDNLSLSYRQPRKMVRGWMQYLYDENGRCHLDVYNNVPHVGHSNPRVVEAVQKQIGLLNTNTRYLHDNILAYADRLTALMPDSLEICYFVNSGSEANELALRLAKTYTGQNDMLVMEAAYHGHTSGLIDISPYKFGGPGGRGAKPWVHQLPIPDDYRGPFKRDDPEAGSKYAAQVQEKIGLLREHGRKFAAFICETLPSVGGQVVLPPNYLKQTYAHVRAAGGVCIADEVQVGFGRLGTHFWGFEMQDAVPDIVVLGKPIGNGFPLAAVVTTRPIAEAFANGMEFFSTFGGNPVACAAGLAVLDEVIDKQLQTHAHEVGSTLLDGLRGFVNQFPIVGDARGKGLFLGLELVRDRDTLTPAAAEASYVVNRLSDHAILAGTDGPYHNVVKIRPPMPFTHRDADYFLQILEQILGEDALRKIA